MIYLAPNCFLVRAKIIPIIIPIDNNEEPPYDIKGNVTPVVGISFNETLIFIKD